MTPLRLRPLALAALLVSASAAQAAPFIIGGVSYSPTGVGENLTAAFANASGTLSSNSYSGLVLVTVSGTGQSLGTQYNDAFYVYAPTLGAYADYYQLAVTRGPTVAYSTPDDAYQHVVYDVDAGTATTPPYRPLYRADHTYTFVLDSSGLTGGATGALRFGVNDGIYSDNSGSFSIRVDQLVGTRIPEPATWLLAGAALALMGLGRRKQA